MAFIIIFIIFLSKLGNNYETNVLVYTYIMYYKIIVPFMLIYRCLNGSVENDQHQKMINMVNSENDHHI